VKQLSTMGAPPAPRTPPAPPPNPQLLAAEGLSVRLGIHPTPGAPFDLDKDHRLARDEAGNVEGGVRPYWIEVSKLLTTRLLAKAECFRSADEVRSQAADAALAVFVEVRRIDHVDDLAESFDHVGCEG